MSKSQEPTGFLLIKKPSGPTSHDVIDQLRKITGIKRIGHAGTLDPFASGLLIVGVGREATRQLGKFLKMDKTYRATLKLGATSDTYDRTGKIQTLRQAQGKQISEEEIRKVLKQFEGEIEQIPPMYSAKKVKGKKLYELARKGLEIDRDSVKIKVREIRLVSYTSEKQLLKIQTEVSSGTYIRSLAHDIGQKLGIGAYLEELERTSIGNFGLDKAIDLKRLDKKNWHKFLLPSL